MLWDVIITYLLVYFLKQLTMGLIFYVMITQVCLKKRTEVTFFKNSYAFLDATLKKYITKIKLCEDFFKESV